MEIEWKNWKRIKKRKEVGMVFVGWIQKNNCNIVFSQYIEQNQDTTNSQNKISSPGQIALKIAKEKLTNLIKNKQLN